MDHDLTETDPDRFRAAISRLSDRERVTLAKLRKDAVDAVIDLTDGAEKPVGTRHEFAA